MVKGTSSAGASVSHVCFLDRTSRLQYAVEVFHAFKIRQNIIKMCNQCVVVRNTMTPSTVLCHSLVHFRDQHYLPTIAFELLQMS